MVNTKKVLINSERAASEFGISKLDEQMPNGECRFRLTQSSGSGYIFTLSGDTGAWQRSHFHKWITEIYIVETGWMALAKLNSQDLHVAIVRAGEIAKLEPEVPHNVYLPNGAQVHTVKTGSRVDNDWFHCAKLDEKVLHLTESVLLKTS